MDVCKWSPVLPWLTHCAGGGGSHINGIGLEYMALRLLLELENT